MHPDDIAEGHRFFTHLLRTGFELFLEGDAEYPALRPFVTVDRKFIGDNTDALYSRLQIIEVVAPLSRNCISCI